MGSLLNCIKFGVVPLFYTGGTMKLGVGRLFVAVFFVIHLLCSSIVAHSVNQTDFLKDYSDIKNLFCKAFNGDAIPYDALSLIKPGFSGSRIYKVSHESGMYAVRIPGDFIEGNGANELLSAQLASDGGYGPKVFYQDPVSCSVIFEFIDDDGTLDRLDKRFHGRVATVLKKMHDRPSSISIKLLDEWLWQVEIKLLKEQCISPLSLLSLKDQQLYENAKQVLKDSATWFEDDITQVHHDPNPFNILATRAGVWLVDWETASQDYFYVDLTVFANFHIYDEALISDFLTAYFGRKPTKEESAKFCFIRPYALVLHGLWLASIAHCREVPHDAPELSYEVFREQVRQRKIDMSKPSVQFGSACTKVTQGIELLKSDEYQEAYAFLKQTYLEDEALVG